MENLPRSYGLTKTKIPSARLDKEEKLQANDKKNETWEVMDIFFHVFCF